MSYFTRSLEAKLREVVSQFPAVLVTGASYVGKSTLLKRTFPRHTYVSFDDVTECRIAKEDPELFLATHPPPLIIDEVQRVPELFRYLKMRIDAHRDRKGQYLLTGSQVFPLMRGVSESLAGRIAIFDLYPMSFKEMQGAQLCSSNIPDVELVGYICRGFYPELLQKPAMNRDALLESYLHTYLERDVLEFKQVTDLDHFRIFLGRLAKRAGLLLNLSEVARESGISQPTARAWLTVLEASYIVMRLPPYFRNAGKRLVKSSKLYFLDTGLLCYLLGIDSADRFLKGEERGHIFENMVIVEVVKRMRGSRRLLYFYRDYAGVEVDLVIARGSSFEAYEIKFNRTINTKMVRPLEIFSEHYKAERAAILCLREGSILIKRNIDVVHWLDGLNKIDI